MKDPDSIYFASRGPGRLPNAKSFEFLRSFLKLERLSFVENQTSYEPDKTATEFWREYDEKNKTANRQP